MNTLDFWAHMLSHTIADAGKLQFKKNDSKNTNDEKDSSIFLAL